MGIAGGMHVTVGAIDNSGNVEAIDLRRRLEIPRPPGLDGRIAGIAQHQRQPADFQIGAHRDDQPRLPGLRQQRRLGLDAVRILESVGRAINLDLVAADFLGQRPHSGTVAKTRRSAWATFAARSARRRTESFSCRPRTCGRRGHPGS
jgi:hypothetical protein